MTDVEVWKAIPSLPEYVASSLGRIMRVPHEGVMPNGGIRVYGGKPTYGCWDEATKRFVYNYKGKNYKIAPLVCAAFNGPKPFPKAVVMHLDEDSTNNTPENIRWGTQKENLNFPLFKQRRSILSKEMHARRRDAA